MVKYEGYYDVFIFFSIVFSKSVVDINDVCVDVSYVSHGSFSTNMYILR